MGRGVQINIYRNPESNKIIAFWVDGCWFKVDHHLHGHLANPKDDCVCCEVFLGEEINNAEAQQVLESGAVHDAEVKLL